MFVCNSGIDYDRVADVYDLRVASDLDIGFHLEVVGKVRGKALEPRSGTGRVPLLLLEAGVDLTCEGELPRLRNIRVPRNLLVEERLP